MRESDVACGNAEAEREFLETVMKRLPRYRLGSYLADYSFDHLIHSSRAQGRSGRWHLARPEPYRSLFARLRMSWDVLRYRADALYWETDWDR